MGSAAFLCRLVADAAVQLNVSGYNRHDAGQKFGITTVDFDLLYTISGRYSYLINGTPWESPAGALLLVAPGDTVSCLAVEESCQLYLHFQLLDKEFHRLHFPVASPRLEAEAALGPLFLREYDLFRQEGNPLPLESLCRLAAMETICRSPVDIPAFAGANKAVLPPALMELLIYLNNHAEAPVSVSEMARQMSMDESYFSRYFTRHMGLSPSRYLTRLRMEAARTLLFQTELSVEEIALRLGYANGFVLSKKFREYFGKSPTKYRKEINGSGEIPVI